MKLLTIALVILLFSTDINSQQQIDEDEYTLYHTLTKYKLPILEIEIERITGLEIDIIIHWEFTESAVYIDCLDVYGKLDDGNYFVSSMECFWPEPGNPVFTLASESCVSSMMKYTFFTLDGCSKKAKYYQNNLTSRF